MSQGSVTRRVAAIFAVAVGCLVLPATASAAFAPTGVQVTPETTGAGTNPDLRIQFTFSDADEQVRDLTIGLPPGLIGNPTVPEVCNDTQLNADQCPANSQVGTVTSGVDAELVPGSGVTVPLTVNGSIYNFTPQPGEPARFGIVLRPIGIPGVQQIVLQSAVKLRADFGLDTVLEDLPQTSGGLSTDITSMDLTLNGQANGGNFIRTPTSCDQHTVRVTANSYETPAPQEATDTFTTTDCSLLDFSPEFAAFAKVDGPDDRTPEVTTQIKQTIEEAGLRTAKVILPASFGANQERLAGENLCSLAEFAASDCPERSIVGSALAETPVLDDPIAGEVSVVDPEADSLPLLGLDLRGPLNLQLLGQFVLETPPDAPRIGTGVKFEGLPDIPISNFELTFEGGKDGLNQSGFDICDPDMVPAFDLTFDSYAGERKTDTQDAETECGGGPPAGRSKARAKLTDTKRPALQLGARDSAGIKRVTFRMPKGVRLTGKQSTAKAQTGNGRPAKVALSRRSVGVKAADARSLRVRIKNPGLRIKGSPSKVRGKRIAVTISREGGGTTSLKTPIR